MGAGSSRRAFPNGLACRQIDPGHARLRGEGHEAADVGGRLEAMELRPQLDDGAPLGRLVGQEER